MRSYLQTLFGMALVAVFFLAPHSASAASLSISPSSGSYEVGDRITVRVQVSGNESINAVSGDLNFSSSLLSVESVSKSGSILNFWVSEPTFSNGASDIKFEGVSLGGFQGGTGNVLTISFRAKSVGTGKISFDLGQILANDGQGTNILQGMSGASFVINEATDKPVAPESVEEELPDEPVKPILRSPEIMLVSKYGEKAVSGTSSYPDSNVVMTFVDTNGVKVFIQGTTDKEGQFLLLVPKTLKRGVYNVFAQIGQRDSSQSASSNQISIKVGNIISDLGWDVRVIFIIVLVLLAYLAFRTYQYIKKNKKIKEETHETKEVIRKSFKLLHEDMENELSHKSSSAEKQEVKAIIKDLDDAESLITKEVKDIEKL